MRRRIKILQLQPECHDRSHDSSDLAEQIIAAFPRERYEVTTAFLEGVPAPKDPHSCAEKAHYFNFPDTALRGLRLGMKWRIFKYCRQEHFDVVICNRYKPVSMLMHLNRWLKIPLCIGISHGLGEYKTPWRRFLARVLMDDAWRFVGVSPAVKQYLIELNCGFTERNTSAINNAIDIAENEKQLYSKEEARRLLELPAKSRIIGSIGRLAKIKGHIHLLRAFAQIHAKYPDVALAIIGDGKEEPTLLAEAKNLGVENRVYLLGWRLHARCYAKAFDILTLPSLSEGLPRALLEGMSAHLPIIASDIPSLRPIVTGAGGLLAPPADSGKLAQALDSYLSLSDDQLQQQGNMAYRYLCANHSIEDYRAAYLSLVENELAR